MTAATFRLRRASPWLLAFVVALLVGLATSSYQLRHDGLDPVSRVGPAPAGSKPGQQNGTFEIAGSVSGLYPGARADLPLKLENGSNVAIRVQSLTVTAGDARPGCGAASLAFGPTYTPREVTLQTNIHIPARGEGFTTIPISLLPTAGDACQLATFPLTYSGTAVKA